MHTLGIVITGNCLKLAGLTGTCEKPSLLPLAETVLKYPEGASVGESLRQVGAALGAVIQKYEMNEIVTMKVIGSQFGNASELRVKMEGVVEMTCAQLGVRHHSVHPNSMKTQARKFDLIAGDSAVVVLGGGKKFRSVEHEQATMCAWCLLFGKGLAVAV